MFYGEFEYKLDSKGRVPVPPRFRRELSDGLVLTPGSEDCINAYPLTEWEKISKNLTSSGSLTLSKMRRLKRAIFASAFSVELDGQGRIALPLSLRKSAEIEGEVVVAGVNNYLEIWSKERWDAEKAVSQEQAWQIIESLERHDGV